MVNLCIAIVLIEKRIGLDQELQNISCDSPNDEKDEVDEKGSKTTMFTQHSCAWGLWY